MRRKRSAASELAEIAVMAPWVIGLRLARFADTRPRARKRNLDEATRMLTEKAVAAAESG